MKSFVQARHAFSTAHVMYVRSPIISGLMVSLPLTLFANEDSSIGPAVPVPAHKAVLRKKRTTTENGDDGGGSSSGIISETEEGVGIKDRYT